MKLPTRLLASAAGLLLTTGVASAATLVAQVDLNMRSGPGIQYPVVGTIRDGSAVNAAACRGGWCRVDYDGLVGWASSAYLTGAPAVAQTQTYYDYGTPYYEDYGYYPDYDTIGGVGLGFYGGQRFHRRRDFGEHGFDHDRFSNYGGHFGHNSHFGGRSTFGAGHFAQARSFSTEPMGGHAGFSGGNVAHATVGANMQHATMGAGVGATRPH